jgi:hypothetical protein
MAFQRSPRDEKSEPVTSIGTEKAVARRDIRLTAASIEFVGDMENLGQT